MSQVRKGARDITVVILAIRRLLGIRVLFLSSTLVHAVKFVPYFNKKTTKNLTKATVN